ncbi:MAG: DNA topoisomerase 1 [Elusimicrobia bacterium ADurb.Bin231]|nr:MAG: DNA topoisomerase 1 [Elusimicrobia bacterium ADurb.Bin231]
MKSPLMIVESPTKAKMINGFLKGKFKVIASMGHVRDLPARDLGVDIENKFVPTYRVLPNKEKIIKEIVSYAKNSPEVFIATDFDREGEAIGWHIAEIAGLNGNKVKRIVFHEITNRAIEDALSNPRGIDINLVDAQQSRRILDRLVGYQISPLLGSKIRKGLSAGRVQSVALALIVERENEINNFKKQGYWSLKALLRKNSDVFEADLIAISDKKIHSSIIYKFFGEKYTVKITSLKSEEKIKEILAGLASAEYKVIGVKKSERIKNPPPPYMTSTLQRDASSNLKFSATRTMSLAQQLYEHGYITYMRTDSLDISAVAEKQVRNFISDKFGSEYIPSRPRAYKTKTKNAQEAHEAIRPTDVFKIPENLKLEKDQQKLYNLIWVRFVASQMASSVLNTVSADIQAKDCLFRATGSSIKFLGYLKVYKDIEKDALLPDLIEGEILDLENLVPKQHFTEPPPRYTEASLIKTLEEHGIGRPSTYAPILATLKNRGYVIIEKMKVIPQQIGFTVTEILKKYFSKIIDLNFTAEMEENLDKIALGKISWQKTLEDFYTPFLSMLNDAKINMKVLKNVVPTNEKCSKCGSPMVIREGRYGKFMACSKFPGCRNTISLDSEGNKLIPEKTDIVCDKCGKPMVIRNGRRGKFIACSGYPKCKNAKNIDAAKREEPEQL